MAVDNRKRSPADVIGEMGYVKHDLVTSIKTILNGAAGLFREQTAVLKRVCGWVGRRMGMHYVCVCVCMCVRAFTITHAVWY